MFITFYGSDFKPLADNSSLAIEKFTITKRSYDLNSFDAVCEPISIDIVPLFAQIKTNEGMVYYDVLRPLLNKDRQNRTKVVGRDMLAVFNSEIFINWAEFTSPAYDNTKVRELLRFLFTKWQAWDKSGFDLHGLPVSLNLANVDANVPIITYAGNRILPSENGSFNVYNLIKDICMAYGLWIKGKVDMLNKTVVFTMDHNNRNVVNIRLEDFGIEDFALYEPNVNTAITFGDRSTGQIRHNWYLLQNGTITTQAPLRDIWPTAARVTFIDGFRIDENTSKPAIERDAEYTNAINTADFEAVSELAEARYQESIEIKTALDVRLKNVDFDTSFAIYYKGKYYKTLPLGEIIDTGKEDKVLRIGYKPIEFIQVIL